MLFSEISIKIFLKRIKADTERQGCVESNFEIKFFKTANGREPVREYLKDMALTNEKVTRDTLDAISELLMMLKAKGNVGTASKKQAYFVLLYFRKSDIFASYI